MERCSKNCLRNAAVVTLKMLLRLFYCFVQICGRKTSTGLSSVIYAYPKQLACFSFINNCVFLLTLIHRKLWSKFVNHLYSCYYTNYFCLLFFTLVGFSFWHFISFSFTCLPIVLHAFLSIAYFNKILTKYFDNSLFCQIVLFRTKSMYLFPNMYLSLFKKSSLLYYLKWYCNILSLFIISP